MLIQQDNIPNCNKQLFKAASLNPEQRTNLAILALGKFQKITEIAKENGTSRKFIYSQVDLAKKGLRSVFKASSDINFNAPFAFQVNKEWTKQTVLSLILDCHSSYEGIINYFNNVLGKNISKGTIYNIVNEAATKAKTINDNQDLSSIKIGAHDEIFQNNIPVLVGCDLESTYCYLLKLEAFRDGTTWGTHLLDLEESGLNPDFTIADGGKGLRCGQKEAWPEVPCHADVFHAEKDLNELANFLEQRSLKAVNQAEKLEEKIKKAKKKKKGVKYSSRLGSARKEAEKAVSLADDIKTLSKWLQNDILSVIGPDVFLRCKLMDFIIEELKLREIQCSYRIARVRKMLENQKEGLIQFSIIQDEQLATIAKTHNVDVYFIRQIFELQRLPNNSQCYWSKKNKLYSYVGKKFYDIENSIKKVISTTIRASSLVENINSRLRNYFFLRKQLGSKYLDLLQFFLNHKKFKRSAKPKRIGKSPRELLTGEKHAHWLELLGYKRLQAIANMQAAA